MQKKNPLILERITLQMRKVPLSIRTFSQRKPVFFRAQLKIKMLKKIKASLADVVFIVLINIKAAYSVTMNIFRKKIFSFLIICKSRIKLCFHNKNVKYS